MSEKKVICVQNNCPTRASVASPGVLELLSQPLPALSDPCCEAKVASSHLFNTFPLFLHCHPSSHPLSTRWWRRGLLESISSTRRAKTGWSVHPGQTPGPCMAYAHTHQGLILVSNWPKYGCFWTVGRNWRHTWGNSPRTGHQFVGL